MTDMTAFREFLAGLPGKMSGKNMGAIVEHVEALIPPDVIHAVEVVGARVPVTTIQQYGLTITLDANDDAVLIRSAHGMAVGEDE